ncbi:MAG: NAD(P)-dependent alcohol dehydrogenase [Deltaproteobacteria bacterium]|nr:NAD(P)-dependent alcohol dehydrogenase [Deltaproteobacteria bacterium]MCF8120686.1 NAD(P)-dependent alcohol dehydrogenase [Deltaproteobacteria bacterium]
MKAAQLYRFDESLADSELLVLEDVSEPVVENPTDVIVRIGGAGVCRTDLELIKGSWCNQMHMQLPMILGHENAGWVEEVGSSVKSVQIGDPVIVHPLGGIDATRRQSIHHWQAQQRGLYPGFNCDGGFAEYMLTEERMLVILPAHLSPMDIAPLADAGLTAYSASRKASEYLNPGNCVLVLGVGGVGHIGIQVLRAISATEIIAIDKSEAALDLARQVGAHYTFIADEKYASKVLALTRWQGVDAVIDFVGDSVTIERGLSVTRRGGHYFLVGYGGKLSISTLELVISQKSIMGVLGGTLKELRELITMVDRGLVTLTTREYSLSEVNWALKNLIEGRNSGRSVLIP